MAFVASSGDDGATDLVAGRLAERPGRRRHRADPRRQQYLVERGRLERQRRRPERLRAATGLPGRRRDPDDSKRANPDVAYDASPSTGFAVYDSFKYEGTSYGWLTVGGTSAGAPQWSALLAIADQGRALDGQPALDSSSPQEVMTTLYKNPGDFHDITSGTSTGTPHYTAGTGYDYVTGLGSPMANLVVGSLDGTTTAASDTLVVTAPTSETAGTSFSLTVTARNAERDDGRRLSGHDPVHQQRRPGRPARELHLHGRRRRDRTRSPSRSRPPAASRSPRPTRRRPPSPAPSSGISVSPAAASQFVLSGLSSTATAGVSQTLTVTAQDAYGNLATGYTGTVQFTSSDAQAILPGSYTFTTADKGVAHLHDHLRDGRHPVVDGQGHRLGHHRDPVGDHRRPGGPDQLAAAAASTSQINLSWTGAAGATGYLIQRSPNGSSGWTQIGTTAAGTTSYQDTGLSAGTTYYYRVLATGGNLDSAFSNTANATTTGGTTRRVDTIWSNSYVPPENPTVRGRTSWA